MPDPTLYVDTNKNTNTVSRSGNTSSGQSVAPGLPFGLGNLPLFRPSFWQRIGVGVLGFLFMWWAVLIFVAQSKAGKAAIGAAGTALVPEGKIASLASKAVKGAGANAATDTLTEAL